MKRKTLKFRVEITYQQAKSIIDYLAESGKKMYISQIQLNHLKNGLSELIITREIVIKPEVKHFNRDITDLMWYSGRRNAE